MLEGTPIIPGHFDGSWTVVTAVKCRGGVMILRESEANRYALGF
jgi:hypothetical protein